MEKDSSVFISHYSTWSKTIGPLLKKAQLSEALRAKDRVLIMPNLVEILQPPITTPVGIIEEIVNCIQADLPHIAILIGEGSGALEYTTMDTFDALGYLSMAREKGVTLIDLNEAPLTHFRNSKCRRWPEMHLPEILFDVFLISVPVLKAHSLAGVTLTMKNMMGAVPPKYYQQGGHWKKASFHQNIQEAVFDLNQYRTPDFTVLDATVGMQEAHLWGPTCNPPHNIVAASFDPVAIDSYGTNLLKRRWQDIGHIKMADGILGSASPLEVVQI